MGTVYNTPWHLTASARAIAGPSPRVGQHNGYVLGEILGLSAPEIASLERAGVLR
jgi:crotonobetainyl-CoA:carnitine CoA-transferase CaiB-like acyl-CoA transferase